MPQTHTLIRNDIENFQYVSDPSLQPLVDEFINKVNLTTRKDAIAYITQLLSGTHLQLWLPHDIAYKIVNVMAHYDIQKKRLASAYNLELGNRNRNNDHFRNEYHK